MEDNIWEQIGNKETSSKKETLVSSVPKQGGLDIDVRRILAVWPLVILLGVAGYFAASFLLRYAKVLYTVSTSINIEQNDEVSLGKALFASSRDPFNDQIAYFKSPSFAIKLVDSLLLNYKAEAKGTLKDKDYYGKIKWKVLNEAINLRDKPFQFELIPSTLGYEITYNQKKFSGRWGNALILPDRTILVDKISSFNSNTPVICSRSDRMTTAFNLSNLMVIASNKESNVIQISYSDYSGSRAIDILNGLTALYNSLLENDKTKSVSQAIDFIDKRIGPLGSELDSIERAISNYKSQNGLVGTSANGELYLGKIKDYDKELNAINIQKQVIVSVESFIRNPQVKEENFALIGIADNNLQRSLSQYQMLWMEKEKLQQVQTAQHPAFIEVQKQLAIARENIFSQLNNFKNNLGIAERNYQANIQVADQLLRKTPEAERELIGKFRMQSIKETLFLTLLQKREEAMVARASVTVKTRILTPPSLVSAFRKPDPSKIRYSGILIGMLIPLLFALSREFFNKKIISKKQLQKLTTTPVLAEIELVQMSKDEPFVISADYRSMIGEQLRSLRTSLNFYQQLSDDGSIILITSSMSGEGKSFLSANLAKSYSMQGKKVALLEFDLRRPKLSKLFGVESNSEGLSSLLIGKSTIQDVVIKNQLAKSGEILDFFPAGKVPPNPQELISGKFTDAFITALKQEYDLIIFDTPPFGIVADAQILGKYANVTLVVTRFNYTVIDQVREIEEWNRKNIFNSMALVFNGIKRKGYFGYKYGYYYYKSKYGNGYYVNEPEHTDKKFF